MLRRTSDFPSSHLALSSLPPTLLAPSPSSLFPPPPPHSPYPPFPTFLPSYCPLKTKNIAQPAILIILCLLYYTCSIIAMLLCRANDNNCNFVCRQ